MGRIITAGVVGALVYFIWGMLAWMALPLHTPTMNELPQERAIADALRSQNLESGVYVTPFMKNSDDPGNPESEFSTNHNAGPIFSIIYRKDGGAPMPPQMMMGGFVVDLLAALLAATLLSCMGGCGKSYWKRVGFVAALGVFVALIGHVGYWNWMNFPLDYTIAMAIDVIVGWTLAGLAIAFFVHPKVDSETGSTAAKTQAAETPAVAPVVATKPKVEAPIRSDAINLLATLQREARFIDIVKEPLADYSDAQVGAAARDVLRDCGTVLDRLFQLQPVVSEEEGAKVDIPSGKELAKFRIAGNASGDAASGELVHHGWRAQKCELPKWTGAKEAALIVAPAELEVK